jgi:hypothetical protein
MPIRFSTEAANADILGEDADDPTLAGASPRAQAAPRGEDRFERTAPRQGRTGASTSEGKPGKDVNAAGFIKDKDAGEP